MGRPDYGRRPAGRSTVECPGLLRLLSLLARAAFAVTLGLVLLAVSRWPPVAAAPPVDVRALPLALPLVVFAVAAALTGRERRRRRLLPLARCSRRGARRAGAGCGPSRSGRAAADVTSGDASLGRTEPGCRRAHGPRARGFAAGPPRRAALDGRAARSGARVATRCGPRDAVGWPCRSRAAPSSKPKGDPLRAYDRHRACGGADRARRALRAHGAGPAPAARLDATGRPARDDPARGFSGRSRPACRLVADRRAWRSSRRCCWACSRSSRRGTCGVTCRRRGRSRRASSWRAARATRCCSR